MLCLISGILFAFCSLPSPWCRAVAPVRQRPTHTPNTAILKIADEARELPPEFAADLLLRLATSGAVVGVEKRRLAEEAFQTAERSTQPFPRKRAFSGPTDSRESYAALAAALPLDRLSLQMRAIAVLLPLDRATALAELRDVGEPKLPPEKCNDTLAYDLTAYFTTVARFAHFTRDQLAEGLAVDFLGQYVGAISSPMEIGPAAKLILGVSADRLTLSALTDDLAASLSQMAPDPRLMALAAPQAEEEILQLAAACRSRGVSPDPLVLAYRGLLERAVQNGLCVSDARQLRAIDEFNRLLASSTVPPLRLETPTLGVRTMRQNSHVYWETPDSKQLLGDLKELRFPPPGQDPAMAFAQVLDRVTAWQGDAMSEPADVFNEKCIAFEALLGTAPGPGELVAAQDAFLRFLSADGEQQRDTRIWFLHFQRLMRSIEAQRHAAPLVVAALDSSSSSFVRAYADEARLEAATKNAKHTARPEAMRPSRATATGMRSTTD